jgi:hypothetical protein
MWRVALMLWGLTLLTGPLVTLAQEDSDSNLNYDNVMTGRLDNQRPRDVYYFDGQRGEVLAIDLEVTSGDLDPVIMVLNNSGQVLVQQDDKGGDRVPSISRLTLPHSDRYYVVVGRFGYSLGSTAGAYSLKISRVGVSSASGSQLRYGDQIINRINNMQPQLYYSFEAQRGDIVDIRMRRVSGDLDPYLQVVDDKAFVIADNDDLLGALNPTDAGIESLMITQDGRYVIIASRYGQAAGTSSGNFVLSLQLADNSGLGNTAQAAIPIQLGETLDDEITAQHPIRYYRFEARANDLISIHMTRLTGGLDSFVVLANAGLVELVSNDDMEGSQNSRISEYRIPEDGTYYIIATRFDREAGLSLGRFRLQLEYHGNAFDAVPEEVSRINYGITVTGHIDDNNPQVLYAFRGEAGDTITTTMNRADGDLNPVVSILDGNFTPLISDDDSGGGQNARIARFTIPQSGTYYLSASRQGEAEGRGITQGSFILVLAQRFD